MPTRISTRLAARAVAVIVVLATIAAHDAWARSDPPNVDRVAARAAYDEGARLYEVKEFRAALDAFKRAYVAWDNPAFLFNIGQCHRRLGETRDALDFFLIYLARDPNARDRGDVETAIGELELELRTSRAIAPRTTARGERRRRAWVWGLVGGGAATAIGLGVGLGVGLTRGGGASFSPTLPDLHTQAVGGTR